MENNNSQYDDLPEDAVIDTGYDDLPSDSIPEVLGNVENSNFGKIAKHLIPFYGEMKTAMDVGKYATAIDQPLPQQKGTSFLDPAVRAMGVPFGIPYNTPVPTPAQIAESGSPNLGAVAQTGQDFFNPAFNYYNELFLNAPKFMMEKMGYQMPVSSSPLAGATKDVAGMAGMARSPIVNKINPRMAYPEQLARMMIQGVARTPEGDDFFNPAARTMGGVMGAVLPLALKGGEKLIKSSPEMLQWLANMVMRTQVPAHGKDVNSRLGINTARHLSTEGIGGANLEEMLQKNNQLAEKLSQQVQAALGTSQKTADVTQFMRRMDMYLRNLRRNPRTNAEEIKALEDLISDISDNVLRRGANPQSVPLDEAWAMKQLIDSQKANSSWGSDKQSTYNALMGQLHYDLKQSLTAAAPEAEQLLSRQSNAVQSRRAIEKQMDNLERSGNFMKIAGGMVRHSPAIVGAGMVIDGVQKDDYVKVSEGMALLSADAVASNPRLATGLSIGLSKASKGMQNFIQNKYPQIVQAMWRTVAQIQQGGVPKPPPSGGAGSQGSGGGWNAPQGSGPRPPKSPAGLPQPPNFQSTAVGAPPAVRGSRSVASPSQEPNFVHYPAPEEPIMPPAPKEQGQLEGYEPIPQKQLGHQSFDRLTGDEARTARLKSKAAERNRANAEKTLIGQRELEKQAELKKKGKSVGAGATSGDEDPFRDDSYYTEWGWVKPAKGIGSSSTATSNFEQPNNILISKMEEVAKGSPHLQEEVSAIKKLIMDGDPEGGAAARGFLRDNPLLIKKGVAEAPERVASGRGAQSSTAPEEEFTRITKYGEDYGKPSEFGENTVGAMQMMNKPKHIEVNQNDPSLSKDSKGGYIGKFSIMPEQTIEGKKIDKVYGADLGGHHETGFTDKQRGVKNNKTTIDGVDYDHIIRAIQSRDGKIMYLRASTTPELDATAMRDKFGHMNPEDVNPFWERMSEMQKKRASELFKNRKGLKVIVASGKEHGNIDFPEELTEELWNKVDPKYKMVIPDSEKLRDTRGFLFSTSSTEENMPLRSAIQKMDSQDVGRYKDIAIDINKKYNLNGDVYKAVGQYHDTGKDILYSEPSLLVELQNATTYDRLKLAAAEYGSSGNQKMVLPFLVDEEKGTQLIHQFDVKLGREDLEKLTQGMIDAGVTKEGLNVAEIKSGQYRVSVYDPTSNVELWKGLGKVSESYGSQIKTFKGQGEFLGSSDGRAAAKKVFGSVQSNYETGGIERTRAGQAGENQGKGVYPVVEKQAGFKEINKNLRPHEVGKANLTIQRNIVEKYNSHPLTTKELRVLAQAGEAKKGWYKRADKALTLLYGNDKPRFVRLMASLSPVQRVEANMKMAMKVMAKWIKAGRPEDAASIERILEQVGGASMTGRVGNATRALQGNSFIEKGDITGLKVQSFLRNLHGQLDPVTNDTWMGKVFGYEGGSGMTTGEYLAATARVREAAKGMAWEPAEGQETIWSAAKYFDEAATGGKSYADVAATVTDADMNTVPEFYDIILNNKEVLNMLRENGVPNSKIHAIERLRTQGDAGRLEAIKGGIKGLDRATLIKVAKKLEKVVRK